MIITRRIIQQLRNEGKEEIADEIERLKDIKKDMLKLYAIYDRNNLSAWEDDEQILSEIMRKFS